MYFYNDFSLTTRRKKFYAYHQCFSKFEEITLERKDEIFMKAILFPKKESNGIPKTVRLYLLLTKMDYLHAMRLKRNDESLLYYMFAIDPNLKLLQIYYEESNLYAVKERFKEEFGFSYDANLLILEKIYNQCFPTIEDEFQNKR